MRQGLSLYEDFMQKKRFAAVAKILQDRAQLPIKAHQQQIIETLQQNSVILIAGDTGLRQVGRRCRSICSKQVSRRSPARNRAVLPVRPSRKRVSFETMNTYGSRVAFQVRFEATKTLATRVLFLTEGLLLRQFAADPLLMQYDVIIVDEVHERHMICDFLLGVLKRILVQRPGLKIVLMSATINCELYSRYFGNAPIVRVPGRMYPVSVEYFPLEEDDGLIQRSKELADSHGRGSIPAKPVRIEPAPYLRILEMIDQKFSPSDRRRSARLP